MAIFGGSFNPPHVGHLLAAVYVLACGGFDRVVIVPCFRHPFAKRLASFDHRMAMCRATFRDVHKVEVSDVEARLGGESLTVRTLEHLAREQPSWSMRLVVGADVISEMDRWTRPERIRELAPPFVLSRIGEGGDAEWRGDSFPFDDADAPKVLPAVSSTQVRIAVRQGQDVTRWIPRAVADYVRAHGLYVGDTTEPPPG